MTKIKKRSKSRSRILSVCLLICIIAVGFSLGGCFKILELISDSLPEPTELKVGFNAQHVELNKHDLYIPAVYSFYNRKFVGVYLRKPDVEFKMPVSGIDDYRNIEGWTLLKEYPIEEYENGERSERVRIGGYYLDMYLTEITIPESFFTEEKEEFYLAVYPIIWREDTGKWGFFLYSKYALNLTYELQPDKKVKIYETED